jgi:hypothetical protein
LPCCFLAPKGSIGIPALVAQWFSQGTGPAQQGSGYGIIGLADQMCSDPF